VRSSRAFRRVSTLALSVALATGCGRVGFRTLDAGLDGATASDAALGPDAREDAGGRDAGLDALVPSIDAAADAAPTAEDAATPIDAPTCATVYDDDDGDGWGADATMRLACGLVPTGLVLRGEDCDDGSALVSPDADEACNGFDDDCDGVIDEGTCDGSVVRVIVSGLRKDESERRLDVDPLGRLLVLGEDAAGATGVEVRTATGALASTHAVTDGPSAARWIRGLRSGWVIGSPRTLERFDEAGTSLWSRTFVGGASGWEHYDAAVNDAQIVVAGSQRGVVDVGTGMLRGTAC
jgi:hypothetical protein